MCIAVTYSAFSFTYQHADDVYIMPLLMTCIWLHLRLIIIQSESATVYIHIIDIKKERSYYDL